MIKLGESGLPDIVVVVPPGGRLLGLECKSEKGRLRPDQIAFKSRAEAVGAHYTVVRTLTQAMEAVAFVMGKEAYEGMRRDRAGSKQAPAC